MRRHDSSFEAVLSVLGKRSRVSVAARPVTGAMKLLAPTDHYVQLIYPRYWITTIFNRTIGKSGLPPAGLGSGSTPSTFVPNMVEDDLPPEAKDS